MHVHAFACSSGAVEPRLTATTFIRSPSYYGHFNLFWPGEIRLIQLFLYLKLIFVPFGDQGSTVVFIVFVEGIVLIVAGNKCTQLTLYS